MARPAGPDRAPPTRIMPGAKALCEGNAVDACTRDLLARPTCSTAGTQYAARTCPSQLTVLLDDGTADDRVAVAAGRPAQATGAFGQVRGEDVGRPVELMKAEDDQIARRAFGEAAAAGETEQVGEL